MTCWPSQLKHVAYVYRHIYRGGGRKDTWMLDMCGEFCFYPDVHPTQRRMRQSELANKISDLLHVPCEVSIVQHNVFTARVAVPDYLRDQLIKDVYGDSTQAAG